MSSRSLTGYDNIDAVSGRPDEEVYIYDAPAGRLVCASCNPTALAPGVLDHEHSLLVDPEHESWGEARQGGASGGEHWLAGYIPTWLDSQLGNDDSETYQPRFLSDSGRLFL